MTNGRLTARPPPSLAMDSGPQPILIDTPPPSANRTTLPPMDAAFEPNIRRGSITDPLMHATSMADPYRGTNGTMPRPSQPLSYQPHINPRPRSIRDESAIPDSPSISERSSFDDSPYPGPDRLHSFTSEHPTHPSLSRRSSTNSWRPAANGEGGDRIFKGFNNQLTNFHLGSTPSLSPSNSSSRLQQNQNGSEYAYSYQAPPHSVVDRHLSIYRNKAGEEKIAPHQAPPVMSLPPKAISDRYPSARTYPYPHPNAPEPTTGYPWAFPDERDEEENRREAAHQASQQVNGQYPMHPSVIGLHPSHEEALRQSQAPYSRSPELRQSHKESERKRRKEQKQLFDELRDILPVDKTLKTSKWEVLSRCTFLNLL
jgi:Helix-loop-helix DNA-binding domain